jgi:hypothetical protein
VEYLRSRGAKDDKKSVGSVLSEPGNQPFRGMGRYMRDETLNLAGKCFINSCVSQILVHKL